MELSDEEKMAVTVDIIDITHGEECNITYLACFRGHNNLYIIMKLAVCIYMYIVICTEVIIA